MTGAALTIRQWGIFQLLLRKWRDSGSRSKRNETVVSRVLALNLEPDDDKLWSVLLAHRGKSGNSGNNVVEILCKSFFF